MNNIKHVCLDKDGTILDVHRYWAYIIEKRSIKLLEVLEGPDDFFVTLAMAMGVNVKDRCIIPIGPVGYKPRNIVVDAAIKALAEIDIDVTNEKVSQIFAAVDNDMQQNDDYDIQILEHAREALEDLHKSEVKISIFSSDRIKNLKKNLDKLNLHHVIDATVGGDEVKQSKPDPDGFNIACNRVDVQITESVYVGDTLDDIIMAKNCNSQGGIGVTTGLCSMEQLQKETKFVFQDLQGVVDFIKERNC